MSLSHNKKRNCGMVYRMLLKCVSESLVERDTGRGEAALGILKKYFAEGTPLSRELALHRVILENRGVDERVARRIISEVLAEAARLDWRVLDIKKSNVIKEINYSLGKDFFDRYRIPEYRAIASTHLLIQERKGNIVESVDRVRVEESVVRYMTTSAAPPKAPPDPERNGLALRLAVKAFNEEFSALPPSQKSVLDAYIVGSVKQDYTRFNRVVESQRADIESGIREYLRTEEVRKDPVFEGRLGQVLESMSRMRTDDPRQALEDIMLYGGILEEIRK